MKYRHLFFDLDHTLWDFEKNADETLRTLFEQHDLGRFGISVEDFIRVYSDINHALWRLYQNNKITQQQLREVRFVRTLARLGVAEADVPADISRQFTDILPRKAAVFPFTYDVLDYLQAKYTLHLITNGFKDIQHIKLTSSRLTHYFQEIITSECAGGFLKPDRRIFDYALQLTGARAGESLMIGDNLECDVLGAYNAGLDQVYFNPGKRRHFAQTTYEISCLSELKDIL
ncbi:YjjG family noncanonical pyrimidine nucleotidase [Hymenobacter sp. BT175]|uniref:YjjG family noncanonical pyrimidine nucleotidase n=1 Tax=Hymenobacter translucens TaxID=2886507 RepID=UPI001D0EA5D8|nr:YjjG family noncanonical pyrimidine nucleotidase [Hymenobacter translucens]MCC2547578.1 YjjG family noncanonical pyrimidine nucleotidase [Hymenobacter translucens]